MFENQINFVLEIRTYSMSRIHAEGEYFFRLDYNRDRNK